MMPLTSAEIRGTVPEAWVVAVNAAMNYAYHEDLCNCRAWPGECLSGYRADQWDSTAAALAAVAVLEPRIRDQVAAEKRRPQKDVITRQLKTAGHEQFAGDLPGFKVSFNRNLDPDGLAVIRMGQFDDPVAIGNALASYALTLTELGYDARIGARAGTLRCVIVHRGPARKDGA